MILRADHTNAILFYCSRPAQTVGNLVPVEKIICPSLDRAVVTRPVLAVAVAGARNAHRVVVVVVPAVLARAVGDPEGGVGGAHARVRAVVRRVVKAPVAGLAAGTREAHCVFVFGMLEDAVVAAYTLTVENVRGERAMGQAGLGA